MAIAVGSDLPERTSTRRAFVNTRSAGSLPPGVGDPLGQGHWRATGGRFPAPGDLRILILIYILCWNLRLGERIDDSPGETLRRSPERRGSLLPGGQPADRGGPFPLCAAGAGRPP